MRIEQRSAPSTSPPKRAGRVGLSPRPAQPEVAADVRACCPTQGWVGRAVPSAPWASKFIQNVQFFEASGGALGTARPTFPRLDSGSMPVSLLSAFGDSRPESQRDSGSKPRVARHELPWVGSREFFNPNGVVSANPRRAATPLGLFDFARVSQGSSCLATLGWRAQSLWDCRRRRCTTAGSIARLEGTISLGMQPLATAAIAPLLHHFHPI